MDPLVFAFLSPFLLALMNVLDKYVVAHKAKNPLSYTFYVGVFIFAVNIIIALFLSWSSLQVSQFIFPILSGFLSGLFTYLYFFIISKEDVSSVIGFTYVYPLLVALLSYSFLHERLIPIGYAGVLLLVTGSVLLSFKFKKQKLLVGAWSIVLLILLTGVYEFFVKLGTTGAPVFHSFVINEITLGATLLGSAFLPTTRRYLFHDRRIIRWVILPESISFFGFAALFLAMAGLKATVVSAFAALQPFFVLVLERIFHVFHGSFIREKGWAQKTMALLLIVAGAALLALTSA